VKALDRRQRVTLEVPRLGSVQTSVEEHVGDVVTLALYALPQMSLHPLKYEPATVHFTTERGVHRLEGYVCDTFEGTDRLAVALAGEDETIQRRDLARAEAIVPAHLWIDGRDGPPVGTYAFNISGAGCLVAGPDNLELGDTGRIALNLRDGRPRVEATVRCVRQTDDERKGLAFEGISEGDREELVRFVMERQRMARRRA